jgi:hypothetical protein
MGAAPGGAKKNCTLAIVSLVAGILAMIPCCNWYIVWLVAIITGFLAKAEIKKNPELGGNTMATVGIVLGFLSLLIMIVLTILQLTLGVFNAAMR